MDKRKLRVVLKVLEAVKTKYLETKDFMEDSIEQKCLKEKISADEVNFFTSLEAKS